jgi:hypothetical protein
MSPVESIYYRKLISDNDTLISDNRILKNALEFFVANGHFATKDYLIEMAKDALSSQKFKPDPLFPKGN